MTRKLTLVHFQPLHIITELRDITLFDFFPWIQIRDDIVLDEITAISFAAQALPLLSTKDSNGVN